MQDVADTVSEEWRAVLELAEAADGQTFREAGGDSVTALRLKAAVEGRLGIYFPVELLFSAAGLATIT